MKNIKIEFSVEEVNVILNALSNRPYAEVYLLMNKIQTEGNRQLNVEEKDSILAEEKAKMKGETEIL